MNYELNEGDNMLCISCKKPEVLKIRYVDSLRGRIYFYPDLEGDSGYIDFNTKHTFIKIKA